MATFRNDFATLVLLLAFMSQARAAEMWRNLEDVGGFDGYISSETPNVFTDNETLLVTYLDATRWSFVRFDVSSLPDISQVQSAKLWLWTEYPGLNAPSRAMYMYPLYVPFNSTTTWNNRNISVYAGATDVIAGNTNGWTVIDITQYYQKWRSGQWVNHGIILTPNAAQAVFNWFSSANYVTTAAKKPRIQVTYTGSVPSVTQFLRFPLDCTSPQCTMRYTQGAYTPGTINSVVDHSMNSVYTHLDGKVLSFTGEIFQATGVYPVASTACYPKASGLWSPVLQNLYKGTGRSGDGRKDCRVNRALNYEAHPGYDYTATIGTPVKAAGSGRIVNFNNSRCVLKGISACASFGAVGIDHGNDYVTQYLHLSSVNTWLTPGTQVNEGDVIGLSGDVGSPGQPHLHFEVLKRTAASTPDSANNYKVVDPYGYDTSTGVPDNLAIVTGVTNIRLWK